MPEERISWKESNLANIGSDLDHKIKAAAAEGEDAWKVIGEAPGVKVWRIEQFRVKEWPTDDYGCFYTGDSYIVLNSYTIPGEDKLYHDLYIWIGAESSQDEYGTAAYKVCRFHQQCDTVCLFLWVFSNSYMILSDGRSG